MKSSVCGAYKFRLPAITASITTMLSNHCSKKHAYPQITDDHLSDGLLENIANHWEMSPETCASGNLNPANLSNLT
eukprot:2346994-Pleurochrysis_carterae.AAC.1